MINIPVYVGHILPLIPDFVDLRPTSIDQNALSSPTLLEDRRNLILSMINQIRQTFQAPPVYEDNLLNTLAQNYTGMMITDGFISHIDRLGRSPQDRAIAIGIT